MAKKFYNPTRMCVSCRSRAVQKELFRLSCKDGELSSYDGVGRSFYLCQLCLDDEKRVAKALMRECRSGKKEQLMNKLKEIVTNE
ncbi:MAG: hypothetical protein ABXS93_02930 [Sulfurimonas sp.]